jgi:hypothetical protein
MSYWCTFWQQNNYIQRRLANKFLGIIQSTQWVSENRTY